MTSQGQIHTSSLGCEMVDAACNASLRSCILKYVSPIRKGTAMTQGRITCRLAHASTHGSIQTFQLSKMTVRTEDVHYAQSVSTCTQAIFCWRRGHHDHWSMQPLHPGLHILRHDTISEVATSVETNQRTSRTI